MFFSAAAQTDTPSDGGESSGASSHVDPSETQDEARPSEQPRKPTIPVEEFGSGVSDSNYWPQVSVALGEIFQQEKLNDITLMAEGQSLPCHKVLLAASSEYFRGIFTAESSTPESKLNNYLLEVEGISFAVLKLVVSYLYTGKVNINVENAAEVIHACNLLKLRSLYDTCVKHLMKSVNPDNCIGLHRMAVLHKVDNLEKKTRNVMLESIKDVLAGKEFKEITEEELMGYIQDENLQVPDENLVFDSVVAWVNHDPDSRKSRFLELIKHVRLHYCTPSYLQDVVAQEPLMESLEAQKVLNTALIYQNPRGLQQKRKGEEDAAAAPPRKRYNKGSALMLIGNKVSSGEAGQLVTFRMENGEWKKVNMAERPEATRKTSYGISVISTGVVVTGGYRGGTPAPVSAKECWHLSTSDYRWNCMPDLKFARVEHTQVSVGEQVYVMGGLNYAMGPRGFDRRNLLSVEYLSPGKCSWELGPDLPVAVRFSMAVSLNQLVYMLGGIIIGNDNLRASQSVFVYSPNTKLWKAVADMPQCCNGSAVADKDTIYVVGGFNKQRCTMSFDPFRNQWTQLSNCQTLYSLPSAIVWRGHLLVCGGCTFGKTPTGDLLVEQVKCGPRCAIEEYDPETDTWAVSEVKFPTDMSSYFLFSI